MEEAVYLRVPLPLLVGPLPNHPKAPYILWQDSPDLSAQVQHRPHLFEPCLSSKENNSQQN